ncbi:hypothetical protein D7V90_07580 [bacterium 1xD42-87]|nr:hypothetical protein D7V90_07580 [bacterium 1xD42-87]
MKSYVKYVECADCGRKIPICNAHYINGKPYGYGCYKKQVALLYKRWEDEKNAEYSVKCFAAMQVFQDKKSNSFHDSICKQWNECKKLTAKQLNCIINGFTDQENINFWIIWQQLTNDECLKWSIPLWVENTIYKNKKGFADYMENEAVINCLLYDRTYNKQGFYFSHDLEIDPERVCIMKNGKNNIYLQEDIEDEYIEVLKVVEGIRK